jgi:hypothetical protein
MMAAIDAPAGARSIAIMRACLVPIPATGLDDAGTDRVRDLPLRIFWAAKRAATLVFDLALVMGSPLKFARRHPPHHLSPVRAN